MEELQERLKELSLDPEQFLASLPAPVAARVEELKKLQGKHDDLEEQYKKERAALEAKYQGLYEPLYKDRAAVVSGEQAVEGAAGGDAKGIPKFWCTVLMRCDITRDIMNEKDPAVLEYLTDIQSETLHDIPGEEEGETLTGFKLKFFFADNPYFDNKVLEKAYYMLDDDEPVLEKAVGTDIAWKPGKNVTVKVMKKKPKKGAKPDAKPLTKTEPVDSFFNFFNPPQIPNEADEMEEEEMEQLQERIEEDYEMGDTIRGRLIPHAVSWYTGEALDEMLDELLADELEDEEEDEEEEEEGGGSARKARRRGPGGAAAGGEQPECKQQ